MKIRFELTIDIDERDWEANYGVDANDKAAIREDVREALKHVIYAHLDNVGVRHNTAARIRKTA